MQPADIAALVTLGPPSLSPDGRHAVVSATRPDLDADAYRSRLWLVATDGSAPPRQLTVADHDTAPVYSPDGAHVAFLRASGDDRPQLFALPVDGGDPRRLTDLRGGAGTPAWSPDSRRLVFSARVLPDGRYGDTGRGGEPITADHEPPRRITGLQYRLDDVGFVLDRPEQLFVVGLDGAAPVRISEGDFDDTEPAWSPDGIRIAFVSRRHPDREHDHLTDVFTVTPDGSDLRQLTVTSARLSSPQWLSDGSGLLTLGVTPGSNGGVYERSEGLFRVDADGGAPQRITDAETVDIGVLATRNTGSDVLTGVLHRGAVDLVVIPAIGGDPRVVAAGQRQISGIDTAAGVTVVSYSDAGSAGELGRVDGDRVVPLTSFATPGLTMPLHDFTATAPDGQELHGFLTLPAGDGPHPVLLLIHGGPYTQYGWTLLDEAQVYAAAGYAVVFANPRGSSGYGEAYGRYIVGDVGERSAVDLLALLDAALNRPELDETRVGVLGGSHGGFMTTWLLGHTDRFSAAVSERAVNAIDSFEGSSDIGWDFADELYGTDPDARRRQSPLNYADRITTPLLIIHSEHDWRCPVEQAQRLYVALRKRNATVEMLLFPGEGHELSRSGLPSHRIARFDAILDWFGRHIR